MDFGPVIRQSWQITRRRPFVWLLALLSGAPVVSCSGFPGGAGDFGTPRDRDAVDEEAWRADLRDWREDAQSWLGDHLEIVVLTGLVLLALAVAYLVIASIAQGALVQACADLYADQPSSLGRCWRAGMRRLWINLQLNLIVFAISAALGAALLIPVLRYLFWPDGGSLQLPAVLLLFTLLSIPLSVVTAYARFEINLRTTAVGPAIGNGITLLRYHPGPSLLAWLVLVALSVAAGIVFAVALTFLAFVLLLLGFAVFALLGGALTIGYAIILGVLGFAGILTYVAALNAFTWHFWTRVYTHVRRLDDSRSALLPPSSTGM